MIGVNNWNPKDFTVISVMRAAFAASYRQTGCTWLRAALGLQRMQELFKSVSADVVL